MVVGIPNLALHNTHYVASVLHITIHGRIPASFTRQVATLSFRIHPESWVWQWNISNVCWAGRLPHPNGGLLIKVDST